MSAEKGQNRLSLFSTRNLKTTITIEANFVGVKFAGADPVTLVNLLRRKFLNDILLTPIRASTCISSPTNLTTGN